MDNDKVSLITLLIMAIACIIALLIRSGGI